MIKLAVLYLFLFLNCSIISAQSINNLYLNFGGSYSDFQDVKYSTVQYGGIGGLISAGFEKRQSKAIWDAGFSMNIASEKATTHDSGNAFVLHPNLYLQYLSRVKEGLYIGGRWDILDFYYRNVSGLGNNSTYYISSSNLSVSAEYIYQKFRFGLDLCLLSYQKENTSFGFSTPQNALEEGEFGYQNDDLDNPFGFKYYQLKPIGQQFTIRTQIKYQFTERFSLGYQWTMNQFAEVKNYPVTYGNHWVTARFNILHKEKGFEKED